MLKAKTISVVLSSAVLVAVLAVPAFAGDSAKDHQSGKITKDNPMPATEAQAQQLKNMPDEDAGAATQEKGMEAGGMPATEAQKQQLKETPNMSTDEAGTTSDEDQ